MEDFGSEVFKCIPPQNIFSVEELEETGESDVTMAETESLTESNVYSQSMDFSVWNEEETENESRLLDSRLSFTDGSVTSFDQRPNSVDSYQLWKPCHPTTGLETTVRNPQHGDCIVKSKVATQMCVEDDKLIILNEIMKVLEQIMGNHFSVRMQQNMGYNVFDIKKAYEMLTQAKPKKYSYTVLGEPFLEQCRQFRKMLRTNDLTRHNEVTADVVGNVSCINKNLEHFALVADEVDNEAHRSIFDALSSYFFRNDGTAGLMKMCTFIQMCEDKNFNKNCKLSGLNKETVLLNSLAKTPIILPITLKYVSEVVGRPLMVHLGSRGCSKTTLKFGNASNIRALHFFELDWDIYPVFPKDEITTRLKLPFPETRGFPCPPVKDKVPPKVSGDLQGIIAPFYSLCVFCKAIGVTTCPHIFDEHVEAKSRLMLKMQTSQYGLFTAEKVDGTLLDKEVVKQLPTSFAATFVAIHTPGHGDCMYNSISFSLVKDFNLQFTLRRAVAVEFHKNKEFYENIFVNKLRKDALDMKSLEKRIYSTTMWGNSDTMLILSKIVSRKILVYSKNDQVNGFLLYDLLPEKSAEQPPIFMLCLNNYHFQSMIPIKMSPEISNLIQSSVPYLPTSKKQQAERHALLTHKKLVEVVDLVESPEKPSMSKNMQTTMPENTLQDLHGEVNETTSDNSSSHSQFDSLKRKRNQENPLCDKIQAPPEKLPEMNTETVKSPVKKKLMQSYSKARNALKLVSHKLTFRTQTSEKGALDTQYEKEYKEDLISDRKVTVKSDVGVGTHFIDEEQRSCDDFALEFETSKEEFLSSNLASDEGVKNLPLIDPSQSDGNEIQLKNKISCGETDQRNQNIKPQEKMSSPIMQSTSCNSISYTHGDVSNTFYYNEFTKDILTKLDIHTGDYKNTREKDSADVYFNIVKDEIILSLGNNEIELFPKKSAITQYWINNIKRVKGGKKDYQDKKVKDLRKFQESQKNIDMTKNVMLKLGVSASDAESYYKIATNIHVNRAKDRNVFRRGNIRGDSNYDSEKNHGGRKEILDLTKRIDVSENCSTSQFTCINVAGPSTTESTKNGFVGTQSIISGNGASGDSISLTAETETTRTTNIDANNPGMCNNELPDAESLAVLNDKVPTQTPLVNWNSPMHGEQSTLADADCKEKRTIETLQSTFQHFEDINKNDDSKTCPTGDKSSGVNTDHEKPTNILEDPVDHNTFVKGVTSIAKTFNVSKEILEYQPPKNFSVVIPANDVPNMFDFNTKRFISKDWACVFEKSFNTVQKCCAFIAEREPALNMWPIRTFARFYGHCGCGLRFSVKVGFPRKGLDLVCDVSTQGEFRLIQDHPTGRQLRGLARKEVAEILQHKKPGKLFVETFVTTPIHRMLHFNYPQTSLNVLQIVSHENKNSEAKFKEIFKDIESFAEEVIVIEGGDLVEGYIHHNINRKGKVHIHMYTEKSLKLLTLMQKEHGSVMYFDATGSVISPGCLEGNQFLLYLAMIKSNNYVFPLAQAISQRGRALEISEIFTHIKADINKLNPSLFMPLADVVVCDFSFAMIHGIMRGVNCMTLRDYLKMSYSIVTNKRTLDPDRSVVFVCTAHLIHSFSRLLNKHVPRKKEYKNIRKLAMHCIARLQECKDIHSFLTIARRSCQVFGLPKLQQIERENVESYLKNSPVTIDENNIMMGTEEILEDDFDDLFYKQLRLSSPFYQLFVSIRKHVEQSSHDTDINPCYNPKILQLIQDFYVPYTPLFSALMLSATGRYNYSRISNSVVESEFNFIKNNFHSEGRKGLNIFIRNNYPYHVGRINSVLKTAQINLRPKKKSLKIANDKNSDYLAKETWEKRRKSKKTPSYFSTDKSLPAKASASEEVDNSSKCINDVLQTYFASLHQQKATNYPFGQQPKSMSPATILDHPVRGCVQQPSTISPTTHFIGNHHPFPQQPSPKLN